MPEASALSNAESKGINVSKTNFQKLKKFSETLVSIFAKQNNIKKFDVVIGMYHDQVLTPIKTIMGFKAINITLGLPFIRVSPDHGVAADIVGKKVADPSSLIESIKLFNNIQ